MPSVLATGFGPIILAVKNHIAAQIPVCTANPDLVIVVAKDQKAIPNFQADYTVILQPGDYISMSPAMDGSGLACTKFKRYLHVIPRSRMTADESDRDIIHMTDAALGFFNWEDQIVACVHGFWPKDTLLNFLTDCEIRLASGDRPIKGQGRDSPDWMDSGHRFEVEYMQSLNRTFWDPPIINTPDLVGNPPVPFLSANRNDSVSQQLTALGGLPPYTWSAVGTLPPGVSLGSDGRLQGRVGFVNANSNSPIPVETRNGETLKERYAFTAVATDANGQRGAQAFNYKVTSLQPVTLPNAKYNTLYLQPMTLFGPQPAPVIWTAFNLPPGLSINSSSGLISGVPIYSGGPAVFYPIIGVPGWGVSTYTLIVDP